MSQTQSSTGITQVGRVMVPVTDQDRALDFYVGTLGFEKRVDLPYGNGDRWIEVAPSGSTTSLALVPPRQGTDDPVGIDTRVALDVEDIESVHSHLKSSGADVDAEISRFGGPVPPMFWLRDADGNTLMLVQPS